MFIFRFLDFAFRLFATVMMVLMLQISVGGQTLEEYLMSFIQTSESLSPVRDVAYSSVRRLNPDVQINEVRKRKPASVSPSSPSASASKQGLLKNMKTDVVRDIFDTILLQYKNMMTGSLDSKRLVEGHYDNLQKELDKIEDDGVPAESSPSSEAN